MMTTTAEVLLDDVTKKVTDATGRGAKLTGDEVTTCCPAHDDASPSLSLSIGRDRDRVIVHCHGPCETEAVVGAVGLTMADLFVPDDPTGLWPTTTIATPPTTYDYHDAAGTVVGQVVRKPGKKFVQRRPDGAGGWTWKGFGRRLYRLPALVEAVQSGRHVFVVEGEKDADRLASVGLVATTCNQGAGKWPDDAAGHFTGAHVAIIGDNDEAGRLHAAQVAAALLPVAAAVKVVALDGLGPHGDVSDWLDAGRDRDDLTAAVVATEALTDPPDPAAAVDECPTTQGTMRRNGAVSPIRSRRASTFQVRAARFTLGGRVQLGALNLLVGIGGLNKSTATARMTADATTGRLDGGLAGQRVTVLFASAEDGVEDVITPRLLAAGADLTRVVIPDEPIALPDDMPRLAELVETEDVGLVVIDPLVAFLDGGTDSHNDASVRQALTALRPLTEGHELTSLAVMHLNKTRARDTYTRISGSAGFFNAARSVMAMTADPRDRDDELARVLWHEKANAGPKARPQACTVVPTQVDATAGGFVSTIRLDLGDWLDGLDIGDALDPVSDRDPSKQDQAEALLRKVLAGGPRRRSDLEERADVDGIGWRTVERAKSALDVEAQQVPEPGTQGAGPSWWRLPGVGRWPERSATPSRTHLADHSLPLDGPKGSNTSEPPNGPPDPQGTGRRPELGDHPIPSTSATCVGCGTDGATLDSRGQCLACALANEHGVS